MINKKRIIYTAGTFDLFNIGHVRILKASKALGDILIVGVSSDDLVKSYKQMEPIISFKERREIVASCKYVDKVVPQTKLLDIKTLKKYKVDCVTIGSDWKGRDLAGLVWMKKQGEVVYLPYTKGISSTQIKRRIIKNSYDIISAELKRENNAK
jgi:glycerol-3-phosphate cytidylyltransferase